MTFCNENPDKPVFVFHKKEFYYLNQLICENNNRKCKDRAAQNEM